MGFNLVFIVFIFSVLYLIRLRNIASRRIRLLYIKIGCTEKYMKELEHQYNGIYFGISQEEAMERITAIKYKKDKTQHDLRNEEQHNKMIKSCEKKISDYYSKIEKIRKKYFL